MSDAITPAEADAVLLAHLLPTRSVRCPLEKCAGRYLLEPVVTDRPQPPFNRIMMDGYAIRSSDGRGPYRVLGLLRAGEAPLPLPFETGTAWEVCTGGVVPPGADVIVPYEHTLKKGADLFLTDEAETGVGTCIHAEGSDQQQGEIVLSPGRRLGSREITVAASMGYATLPVRQHPRVGILSTGDELVDPADTPKTHQIRRSNDLAIDTALALNTLHAQTRTSLPDDPDIMQNVLAELMDSHDLLICTGGVSKGAYDHLPDVLTTLGSQSLFRRVRQKPGQPMGFWTRNDCRIFTLPGNPLSVLCGLHRYVLPFLHACLGASSAFAAPPVQTLQDSPSDAPLTRYLPVKFGPDALVTPCPFRNSGDLIRPLESDGFLAIPPHAEGCSFPFYPWY